jgi:hypothetical protein
MIDFEPIGNSTCQQLDLIGRQPLQQGSRVAGRQTG